MKMAKASQEDLDMAMELVSAFDALGQRWNPCMPEQIAQPRPDFEGEMFDRDDDAQCGRAMRYLLNLVDRASLSRVVWGMAVVCDPANRLLDPNADTLEVHPVSAALLNAAMRLEDRGFFVPVSCADSATLDDMKRMREALLDAKGGAV